MNYATIKYCDIANGVVAHLLFVSGCRLHCKNCFNEEAWSFSAGKPFTQETEEVTLVTCRTIRRRPLRPGRRTPQSRRTPRPWHPSSSACGATCRKNIWMYSGAPGSSSPAAGDHASPDMDRILACLNVLVDGPFVQELHDITLRFRGSSNQRLIDVPATLATGKVTIWEDDPQFAQHAWA